MKLGFDVHGVIDKNPKFFAKLIQSLRNNGHIVHIITGVEDGDRIRTELSNMGIQYDYLFSITSYHKSIGTPMYFKNNDPNHPFIDDDKWNSTKALYCKLEGIHVHVDDSDIYGEYFKNRHNTAYIKYDNFTKILFSAISKLER